MRVKLHRPRYQRNARILLAAALLIPAAGFLPAAVTDAHIGGSGGGEQVAHSTDQRGPLALPGIAVLALVTAAVLVVLDALRWVAIVTRHGIGIAGRIGVQPAWIAWSEIVRVDEDNGVVSIETRGRQLYQLGLSARAAGFVSRTAEREQVRLWGAGHR